MGTPTMVHEKTWKEFRESGLLWFINTILHLFGWAIVVSFNQDNKTEDPDRVYPARVKFRGFSEDINTNGYKQVSQYLLDNMGELAREANED